MAKQFNSSKSKKKQLKNISSAVVHIKATFNNTIVTITDPAGNVIAWVSAGKAGYSGSRKSSAFAATVAAEEAGKRAKDFGVKEVEVYIKGPGAGREAAVRGIASAGLDVTKIGDRTPVPHNGCRPRKRRRV